MNASKTLAEERKISFVSLVLQQVIYDLKMGMNLGIKISAKGRNNDVWAQVFKQNTYAFPLHIKLMEFLVLRKKGIFCEIGGMGIKIGVKLFIQGIADKAASP